jgi:nucleoside-diphosphate-sugar epimerase
MTTNSLFLTGGSGFVGTHVRQELAERGVDVTLLLRSESNVERYENESIVRGDLTHLNNISIAADSVLHLAARTNIKESIAEPTGTWEVNANGTLNLLELSRSEDVDRFCYVSTASVYGPPVNLPVDEGHTLNPGEPYGASKLAGDRLAGSYNDAYGISTVIVRPFNLFGPRQPEYNVIPTIVKQALNSDRVELGNLSPERDFTYVNDAVSGILTVLEKGAGGEAYNLGRGEAVSIGTLAELITEKVGGDTSVVSVQEKQRNEGVEIAKHAADPSKLKALGWEPRIGLETGLDEVIRYQREQSN